MVRIGEDITEQLDEEPAKFFVHRHIRPQIEAGAAANMRVSSWEPGKAT